MKRIISLILLGATLLSDCAYADNEETVTITSYYPTPYALYNELRSKRIAIGDNYGDPSQYSWSAGTIDSNADLVVEGNVGVGTRTPTAKLDIQGQIRIVDGNQGNGKLLVSNSQGLATWSNRNNIGDIMISTQTCTTADCTKYCPDDYMATYAGWSGWSTYKPDVSKPVTDASGNHGWRLYNNGQSGSWTMYLTCIKDQ